MNEIMTENYCDDCDDVLHAVFNEKDFWNHKVGRIRCKCGCVVKPCNDCSTDDADCSHCPWEKALIADAMTDTEYVGWLRKNQPKIYAIMRKGDDGDYYQRVCIESEAIEKHPYEMEVMKSLEYLIISDDTEIVFRKRFQEGYGERRIAFNDWDEVKSFCNDTANNGRE